MDTNFRDVITNMNAPARPATITDVVPPAPTPQLPPAPPSAAPVAVVKHPRRHLKKFIIGLLILMISAGTVLGFVLGQRNDDKNSGFNSNLNSVEIPLGDFLDDARQTPIGTQSLAINGRLQINDAFVLSPSTQPSNASRGQLYYDGPTDELVYFNGTEFIPLREQIITGAGISNEGDVFTNTGVLSLQGQTGSVTLTGGSGIVVDGTTLINSGVVSFGGSTGDIIVGNGLGMSGNTLTNTGVTSVASGSSNLTVTNDGSGNVTISSTAGSGTGTVDSPNGTPGRIAKFTGVQTIEDSLLSEAGSTITVNGDLEVTGNLTLGTTLSVSNGGTGATTLTNNGILLGQGTGSVSAVTAAGPGLCLQSTAGAPIFTTCVGSGDAVTSLNGLTGTLTIANATGLVNTITIDDASTTQKGIAQFDGTNFTATNGEINTIQNINTTASPTFNSLTLGGDIAVNGGDITSTGALNITPAGTLTAGSTTQAFSLQGNASSVIAATNGASTTSLTFQSPTANVTYRYPTAAAGTYDICTTSNNCGGGGGGVIGSGTVGTIPKFTAGSAIGDSLISESGSTITVNGDLNLTAGNQFQINGVPISSADLSNDANLAKLNASQTFTGNTLTFRNGSNSATAFSVQNAATNRVITVDTTAGELELGQGSVLDGRLVFNTSSNANTVTLVSAVASGNRTITLPNDSGTVCLDTGNCGGAGVTLQTAYNNSTSPEIVLDATRGALTVRDSATPIGANLLEVQNNAGGTTYFGVSATGTNTTGSSTATGNINSSGGSLQTNGTTRVDNSGNLTNIGNIGLTGAISGGTTYTGSGNINTTGGSLQTNSTTRVDNSGNLTNIGNITGTGAITIASSGAGNDITINGADEFIVQDAAIFNGTGTFNTDVDLVFAETENLSITSTVTGTNSVNLLSMVLTNNTASGTQNVAFLQNAAGSGTTDGLLILDNADTDTAVTSGVQITSAAGGVTNALDVSDSDIVTALLFGANDITGTNFSVTGGTGSFVSAGNGTLQGGTLTVGTSSQAGSLVLNDGSSNTGTLQLAALGQNTVYTLPDPGAAAATICLSSGNCSGSAVTLQGAYDNSTNPEITLDATRGALTLRDNATPIAANLFEVQNNAGAITYFNVTTAGVAVTGTATVSGNINSTGGALQTNSTTRVDNSGNLTNIGNIGLTGAISGGTTYTGSGNINTTGGSLQTNSTTRVDNSGNLTNIGNITGTGAITIASSGAGNDVIINGADEFIVQDAAVFNGLGTFNTDVDLTLAETENLSITNTVTGTNSVNLISAVLTNNSASGTQNIAFLQNAAGSGTTDGLLVLDNADTDTAVTNGIQITSAAGGVTTALDVSDSDIVTALLFGANDITGTNFSVTGGTGSFTSAGNGTLQGGTLTTGTTSQAGSLVVSDGSSNTGTIQVAALGSNRVYTFPDATGTVCLDTGNCAGAGGTLQTAYNNSTSPEITLDATRGALTIRDNATPIAANLFEVQNNAGGTTYFNVTATGIAVTGTATASGNINSTGGALQTNSTTRVDNTGNLTNIGNLTATAGITIASTGAGNDITIDGADQFIVQDAAVFNGTATFNTDIDLTLADTENLNITNTATSTSAVNLINTVLTNNTSSGTQRVAVLQNAAGSGSTEALLLLDNADTDTAVAVGLQITAAAGAITTAIDLTDADIVDALSVGANNILGTTGNIDLTNFDVVGSTGNVTAGTYNSQTISNAASFTGTLAVAGNTTLTGDVAVNGGDITSTGALNITPTGTLTAGSTGQTLTLQGNASTTLRATDSGNTSILAFSTPTANVTFNLPALAVGTYSLCTSSGNCGGVGATLQTAYTNSSTPEITLDGTRGALTIRDNTTPIAANLLEVQNNGGGSTFFAVTVSGTSTTGTTVSSGTINTTGGTIQTNSTDRISNGGNLVNIGSLTLGGAISGGTTYTGSGNINTTGGALQTNTTDRIDNSGNLVNIGNITATGATTIASTGAGNDVIINGADQFIVQDASVFNGTGTFNTDVDFTLADTENVSITNTVTSTNSVDLISAVLTNNTSSGTQRGGIIQNAAGSGTTEALLVLDNADTDTAVTSGLLITSAAGGITTALDLSDSDIVDALNAGANNIVGTTGNLDFTNFDVAGATGNITAGTYNSQTISSAASFTGTVTIATNLTLTSGDIAVNGGNITSTGALSIDPGGSLTVGATGQTLTLRGSGATTLTATASGNTTTISFEAPTANTNIQFPALAAGSYEVCTSDGNCPAASTTLQGAYNSSTTPEITLDATRGALTIRDNATPIAANLFEIQNNGGSTTFLAVTTAGISVTGTATTSGNINTTGGTLQTNSTSRVDNSGNLVNIGNLTATGAITIASTGAGNDVIIDGADQFIVQDVSTFNGAVTFNTDIDAALAETENIEVSSTVTGTNSVNLLSMALTNNTSGGTQQLFTLQNSAGSGATEALALLHNADTDTAVTSGIQITSAAGSITTAIDLTDADIVTALNVGANDIVGTTGNLDFSNFDVVGSSGNVTTAGTIALALGTADTATALCRNTSNQIATCTGGGTAFIQNGNSFGGTATLGTNDGFDLNLERGGVTQLTVGNGLITLANNVDLTLTGGTTTLNNRAAGSADTLVVSNSTSTGTIAVFKDNATTVMSIGDGGAVLLQNETNQLSAFEILTTVGSGANILFNADTINERIGIGAIATTSKLEVHNGDVAVYNSGNNPKLILGDSTAGGQNGYLQWDSASNYFRIETVGTNGLKINDNFVAIGNIFPSQPLIVGNGSTNLFQINTSGVASLIGGQTADITTASAATATALALQPGATTGSNGTGAAISLKAGDESSTTCGTACTGGTATIQGGSATGASGTTRNGGSVIVDAGTGATANGSVTIGNTNAANLTLGRTTNTQTTLSGAILSLQGGTGATAVTITTGSGGTLSVGNSGVASTIQIGNTTGAVSQTINIGNNSTASSTNNVNIGSSIAGTTAITGPTTITNRTSGAADTFVVGNSTSTGTIALFRDNATTVASIADGGATLFQNQTNSTDAFRVLNSAGSANELVGVDSTNSILRLLANNTGNTGTFTATNSLTAAKDTMGYTSVNGYLYSIVGCTDDVSTNTVYYTKANSDGTVGTWAATTVLPVSSACGATATSYNGYIYVSPGATNGNVYYAKPNTDGTISSWNVASSGAQAVDNAKLVAYNGHIYQTSTNNRHVYYARLNADGTIGSWTTVSNWLGVARTAAAVFIANGFLYVIGGDSANTSYYGRVLADGSVGTTTGTVGAAGTTTVTPGTSLGYSSPVIANGYVYLLGGFLSGAATTANVYYAALNADGTLGAAWGTNTSALPEARDAGAAWSIGNNLIYAGGWEDGTTKSEAHVWYSPLSRLRVGGGLDLTSYTGENMAENGAGGQLTAGNTSIAGTLNVTGNATFKDGISVLNGLSVSTPVNSDVAFSVLNSTSLSQFSVDTTNSRVNIGSSTADAVGVRLLLDSKDTTGDPTGVNGAIYYNIGGEGGASSVAGTAGGKMRCFEGGVWQNCLGMRDIVERRWGYAMASNTVTPAIGLAGLITAGQIVSGSAGTGVQAESNYVAYTTAATTNSNNGWGTNGTFPPNVTQPRWLPKMVSRVRVGSTVTTVRYWVALTEASMVATNPTIGSTAEATSYMGLIASTTVSSGAWICGSGNGTNHTGVSTGVILTASHYYDMIVDLSTSGTLVCSISDNGGPFTTVTKTTTLPPSTDTLGISVNLTTLANSARDMFIQYVYIESE